MAFTSALLRIGAAALGLVFLLDGFWAIRGRKFAISIAIPLVFDRRIMQGLIGRMFGLLLIIAGALLLVVARLGIGS